MGLDIDHLRTWIGRSTVAEDVVVSTPLSALTATLDRYDAPVVPGEAIPPCWHWLYFLPVHRQSEIGPDGHSRRGGFLPPVSLPRRMWAGSKLEFVRPITVGQSVVRHSRIEDVRMKHGRTGPLVFVKVLHEVQADAQTAIREWHDIVYRDMPQAGDASATAIPAPTDADWIRRIVPDGVLLFRYSALTFNGHRIHYDRPYAVEVEAYPGLVVHGPLIATLLLDLLRRQLPEAQVAHFEFRALRPVFDVAPFEVCGRINGDRQVKLWAVTPEGHVAMDASVTLA